MWRSRRDGLLLPACFSSLLGTALHDDHPYGGSEPPPDSLHPRPALLGT